MENKEEFDEFYIGYIDHVAPKTKGLLKTSLLVLFILVIGFALAFSLAQNKFDNATFELTEKTRISGIYFENPYPMLRVATSDNTTKDVLLLGFGKAGAQKYIENTEDLNGTEVAVEGNLIYYNGKTLMQILSSDDVYPTNKKRDLIFIESKNKSTLEVSGEIIDPKCYFGVMKPGKGKIHRSCAIRCLSGGIPPVFLINSGNKEDYLLLTDLEGNPVQQDILDFVGKTTKIKGELVRHEDWNMLRINPKDIEVINGESKVY